MCPIQGKLFLPLKLGLKLNMATTCWHCASQKMQSKLGKPSGEQAYRKRCRKQDTCSRRHNWVCLVLRMFRGNLIIVLAANRTPRKMNRFRHYEDGFILDNC